MCLHRSKVSLCGPPLNLFTSEQSLWHYRVAIVSPQSLELVRIADADVDSADACAVSRASSAAAAQVWESRPSRTVSSQAHEHEFSPADDSFPRSVFRPHERGGPIAIYGIVSRSARIAASFLLTTLTCRALCSVRRPRSPAHSTERRVKLTLQPR